MKFLKMKIQGQAESSLPFLHKNGCYQSVAAVCRLFGFAASLQGALVLAELFLTFVAAHGTVAAFIETVRMTEMSDLPADQKDDGKDAG